MKNLKGRELTHLSMIGFASLSLFMNSGCSSKDSVPESQSQMVPMAQLAPTPLPPAMQAPADSTLNLSQLLNETRSPEEILAEMGPIDRSKTVINSLAFMLLAFRCHTGRFPTQEEGLTSLLNSPGDLTPEQWRGPYASESFLIDPWGVAYRYVREDNDLFIYDLRSAGEDTVFDTTDDIALKDLPRSAQFSQQKPVEAFIEMYVTKADLEHIEGIIPGQ